MAQLTKQDVAEVVEEVLDRKLDEKFDEKLGLQPGKTFDELLDRKLDEKLDEKLDQKLDQKLDEKLDEKLDSKLGAFVEHIDDKFDALAETVSVMNSTMMTLARQSDVDEIKQDVKTIKLAVRETNRDLHNLEDRFDRFERSFP